MNLIEQLIQFHLSEAWQKDIPEDALIDYFQTVIDKGRIIEYWDGEILAGYIESWRLTPEQFGRAITFANISVKNEDVEHGPICYVANMSIRDKYAGSNVMSQLRKLFMDKNADCEFITGTATKHGSIKVYKRQEYWNKFLKD